MRRDQRMSISEGAISRIARKTGQKWGDETAHPEMSGDDFDSLYDEVVDLKGIVSGTLDDFLGAAWESRSPDEWFGELSAAANAAKTLSRKLEEFYRLSNTFSAGPQE